jgi:enterochelin esterase-like enzyme
MSAVEGTARGAAAGGFGRVVVTRRRRFGRPLRPGLVALAVVITVVGLVGAYRYVWTFWLYRGFPPPQLPVADVHGHSSAVLPGVIETIEIDSPAVGATLPAIVYLPPGYNHHPDERYPTIYLLHGVPGSPQQFVDVGDVQVAEALLVARHQMPPAIIVMPEGSPSLVDDTEWVNSVEPHQDWMTYVATDVVNAVDRRFRTIDSPADRAIAGLSEGGYGALDIGLQHLGEFGLIESWSGYTKASTDPRYFGHSASLVAANSPAVEVRRERAALLADHTYIWFYDGDKDEDLGQNVRFNTELSTLELPHHFFVRPGSHNWKLWRALVSQSLIEAGKHFGQART